MSIKSERVKLWRRRCKNRIVMAMGGACCICGYNKCDSSLALHHLDPSQKDIGLGAIRANPKNWDSIVIELRKCVLVCHNCHSEIHAWYAVVPENTPRFDENFSSYDKLKSNIEKFSNSKELNECPVCGRLKPISLKNCSLECAGRSKYKVNWDTINLMEELKTKSVVKLAEELGCSDGAIHKRLKKLGLK